MERWTGKFVIGLTGNIATGKSEVRKMLERLGAFGIDADALVHLLLMKEAPAYAPVVAHFGAGILNENGQIERARLGQIVFADPNQLAQLEALLHPFVVETIKRMIEESELEVIVVEAIKLIEAGLARLCDSLWVTSAPPEMQLQRLMEYRGLSEAAARLRISAQPSQSEKTALADVVIDTSGDLERTWQQVQQGWQNARTARQSMS